MQSPPSSDRAEEVRRLFDELVELSPPERTPRLTQIGRRDAELRHEVERLLAAHDEADAVLSRYGPLLRGARHAAMHAAAEDDADPRIGQSVAHYTILERLGGGGMGEVYKARDARLGRTAALKFLSAPFGRHPDAKQRFVQEAQAASALDHPNICTIYEIGETDAGQPFIAMAYYEGETLEARIARGPLPIQDAVDIAVQIAQALHRAHEAGVIHRDIKPANVMLTEAGPVKLLDFGIAKVSDANLTRTGQQLGTVAYMSPEQIRDEPADRRTDLWALGVMLYEMLAGERPFRGVHQAAILHAIQTHDPVPIRERRPDVPEALARIVHRALQKDPADRYPSLQALADDLRRLTSPAEPSSRTATEGSPGGLLASTARWRLPTLLTIAAGIAILIGLGTWVWWNRVDAEQQPDAAVAPITSIGVMYFDNLTGDPSLDWVTVAIVEMLTANLGRFEGVEVLSSQRLFDIMQQVANGESAQIDRHTATEIAQQAGIRTMLLGSLIGDQQHLRLSTQFVDVPTGELVGAEVVDAGPDGSLITLADTLTQRIATRLAIQPSTPPAEAHVAYTLTNSPAALRHYVQGLQALYRSNFTEAVEQFDAATAADSAFAMAYYHRELAYSWQTGTADRDALERALRFGDRLSERERALIEATFTMLEDLPTRKTAFERLTTRYPDEKFAWYQLGEILYHNYWPRASVDVFNRSIELDPYFLIGYVHLADFYFHTDEYDKALPLLNRVLSLDSTNIEFHLNQAYLNYVTRRNEPTRDALQHLLERVTADTTINPFSNLDAEAALTLMTRDFARMEDALMTFRDRGYYGTEGYVMATNSLAGVALLQGDLAEAERYLQEARQKHPRSPSQLYEEGLFWLLRGETERARTNAQAILNLHDNGTEPFTEVAALGRHLLLQAHLADDNLDDARQVLAALGPLRMEQEHEYTFLYDDALGRVACYEGRTEAALHHFARARPAISFTGTQTGVVLLFHKLLLDAQLACLEQAGAYETLLQRTRDVPIFVYHFHDYNSSTMAVMLRTLLRRARAHEALGQTQQAVAAYEEFLSFWEEPGLPGVHDARQRLARLTDR